MLNMPTTPQNSFQIIKTGFYLWRATFKILWIVASVAALSVLLPRYSNFISISGVFQGFLGTTFAYYTFAVIQITVLFFTHVSMIDLMHGMAKKEGVYRFSLSRTFKKVWVFFMFVSVSILICGLMFQVAYLFVINSSDLLMQATQNISLWLGHLLKQELPLNSQILFGFFFFLVLNMISVYLYFAPYLSITECANNQSVWKVFLNSQRWTISCLKQSIHLVSKQFWRISVCLLLMSISLLIALLILSVLALLVSVCVRVAIAFIFGMNNFNWSLLIAFFFLVCISPFFHAMNLSLLYDLQLRKATDAQ